jgi:hypothetical protein
MWPERLSEAHRGGAWLELHVYFVVATGIFVVESSGTEFYDDDVVVVVVGAGRS